MKHKKPMKVGGAVLEDMGGGKIVLKLGGRQTTFEYKELWGVTFVLGTGKYRDEMLPSQKKEMMVFSRKHVVEAQKDIKKGEQVVVWCEVNVPKTVVDAIAEENGAKVIYQVVEKEVIPTPDGTTAEPSGV